MRGFTLIEVLVAIILIGGLLISVGGVISKCNQETETTIELNEEGLLK